jgi:hypothetical protein
MILLRLAIIESNQDIHKMPALRTLTIAIHPATHRLPARLQFDMRKFESRPPG